MKEVLINCSSMEVRVAIQEDGELVWVSPMWITYRP